MSKGKECFGTAVLNLKMLIEKVTHALTHTSVRAKPTQEKENESEWVNYYFATHYSQTKHNTNGNCLSFLYVALLFSSFSYTTCESVKLICLLRVNEALSMVQKMHFQGSKNLCWSSDLFEKKCQFCAVRATEQCSVTLLGV